MNGEVLHSIQGYHDVFFLAEWYDEAVEEKISKTKYISDLTPVISPDMIKYLDDVKAERRISMQLLMEKISEFLISLEKPNTNDVLKTLYNNPFLFDFIIKGTYVVHNFHFGDNFKCDFLVFGIHKNASNIGLSAVLIKAESHQQTVLNNDENLNDSLVQSLKIIENWKDWLSGNSLYLNNVIVDFLTSKQEFIRSDRSVSGLYSKLLIGMAKRPVKIQFFIIAGQNSKTSKDICIKRENSNNISDSVFVYNYNVFIDRYFRRTAP